jgi:hypothetical protein
MARSDLDIEYMYTPGTVAKWVRSWGELCAKAETPSTSYGVMVPGQTPTTPKISVRSKGFSTDKLNYATIKADIERVRDLLDPRPVPLKLKSLQYRIIYFVQFQYTDYGIASGLGITEDDVRKEFYDACKKMATMLGWEPEEIHPYMRGCACCGGPIQEMRSDAEYCSPQCRLKAWRASAGVRESRNCETDSVDTVVYNRAGAQCES